MPFFNMFRNIRISATTLVQLKRNVQTSGKKCYSIAEDRAGTYKPSPYHQKILVWTKTYKSVGDIPERVTRAQMKTALDKFRVKVSIVMVAITFFFSTIFALSGRKERLEGKTVTKLILKRREEEAEQAKK